MVVKHGEPERRPDLLRHVDQRRGHAGPLLGDAVDGRERHRHEAHPEAEGGDEERGHDVRGVRGVHRQRREPVHAQRRHQQARTGHGTRREALDQLGADARPEDDADAEGQRGHAGP